MDIAVMTNSFPKLSETFILNEITGLIDNGHAITITANRDPKEPVHHRAIDSYSLRNHAIYPPQSSHGIRKIVNLLSIVKLSMRAPRRTKRAAFNCPNAGIFKAKPFLTTSFDIVHSHFGPIGITAAELKQHGIITAPLVASFHGWGIREGRERGGDIYTVLFDSAEVLLVNSPFTRDELLDFGAPPEKIQHHTMGIDLERFNYQPPTDSPRKVTILSVGRLVEEKGHEDGIRAVHEVLKTGLDADIEYRIVGGGPLENELLELIDEMGLSGTVTLVGPVRHDQVVTELEASDIFLHPSHSEGLGMVLLEAQAVGLPIVATRVGGIPNAVVPDESALLVEPGDVAEMASALRDLITDPGRWQGMSESGREFVEREYDVERSVEELLEIYEGIT